MGRNGGIRNHDLDAGQYHQHGSLLLDAYNITHNEYFYLAAEKAMLLPYGDKAVKEDGTIWLILQRQLA
jgi:hypothetical protein